MSELEIRPVTRDDVDSYLTLVDAHADFEKMERPSPAARKRMVRHLLMDPPKYHAYLASTDGRDVGYAVTYEGYSSFIGQTVLYLEDIFLLRDCRGRGFGQRVFNHMVKEAGRRGCGRMEWMVQDWNDGAMRFYERQGGEKVEGWHTYRIEEDEIREALESDPESETAQLGLTLVGAGETG